MNYQDSYYSKKPKTRARLPQCNKANRKARLRTPLSEFILNANRVDVDRMMRAEQKAP